MKQILFALVLGFTVNAWGFSAEEIYSSLAVHEVEVNPGIVGSSKKLKEVQGLACTRSMVVVPNAVPSYVCQWDADNNNAEEIYNALNVEAINLNPGIAGASRFEKSVGGLSCIRSLIIVPNATPEYECILN